MTNRLAQRREVYQQQLERAGHELQRITDPDDELRGGIDWFAMNHEPHNGPRCVRCHDAWCEHCNDLIHSCPGPGEHYDRTA